MSGALVTQGPVGLLRVEEAREILAECKNIDEARSIRDKAEAIRTYMRTRGASREAEQDAAEIRLRAERRLGELIPTQIDQGRPEKASTRTTLSNLGISRDQSSKWQSVAGVPPDVFESFIAEQREKPDGEITTAGLLRALRRQAREESEPETEEDEIPKIRYLTDPAERSRRVDDLAAEIQGLAAAWPRNEPTDLLCATLRRFLDMLKHGE